jgi:Uncharacterised protein family (UPF0014)
MRWHSTSKLLLLLLAPLILALLLPPAAASGTSTAHALQSAAVATAGYHSSAVSTAVMSNTAAAAQQHRPAAAATAVTDTAVTDSTATADTGVAHLSWVSVALGIGVMSIAVVCSYFFSLGLEWQYIVAAFRTTAQLSVLGSYSDYCYSYRYTVCCSRRCRVMLERVTVSESSTHANMMLIVVCVLHVVRLCASAMLCTPQLGAVAVDSRSNGHDCSERSYSTRKV